MEGVDLDFTISRLGACTVPSPMKGAAVYRG